MVNKEKSKKILPNGLEIEQMNDYETDFIYKEIFEEKVYLKNDIILKDDSCIFDIGANIGLFSLYNLLNLKNAKLFSFEPSPRLCEMIRYNTREYSDRIKVFQCGLSSKEGSAVFSFYPGYSIISGFKTDSSEDMRTIKSGLLGNEKPKDEFEELCINEMLEEKLKEKEEYDCPLRTVSSIIKEENIKVIDLLKIDAEKSELEIMAGIDDQDWDIIMQLIMEVHDIDNKEKDKILALLTDKGFEVVMDEEDELRGSGIVNVFAVKSEYKKKYGVAAKKEQKKTICVAANFSMEPLFEYLPKAAQMLDLDVQFQFADYNQVFQELLNVQSIFSRNEEGDHFILLKPDDWLRYKKEGTDEAEYLAQICDDFLQAAEKFGSARNLCVILCPISEKLKKHLVFNVEEQLYQGLMALQGVTVVNAESCHASYEVEQIYDALTNEMGHLPYTSTYYAFLSVLMLRRFFDANEHPFKVIIVDCDNTIWSGICGESSIEELEISHGQLELQKFLEKKFEEGFLLGLCSKNNEEDVWKVFQQKEEMVLQKDHLVTWRINWNSKSQNLYEIAEELNVGMDSILFLDDNLAECNEVRQNCSEVTVLQWPVGQDVPLEHIWKLDKNSITEEDRKRYKSYQMNAKVKKVKAESYTYKQFIEELNIQLDIEPLSDENSERVAQLTQRTNQFNFTTIRRDQNQLLKLIEEGKQVYTVSVKDRFGDYGIVGMFMLEETETMVELESFMLSCRVLGRGIEYKIFKWIGERMKELQQNKFVVHFVISGKNQPAKAFLDKEFEVESKEKKDGEFIYVINGNKLLQIEYFFLNTMIEEYSGKKMVYSEEIAVNARSYEKMQEVIWEQMSSIGSMERFLLDVPQKCEKTAQIEYVEQNVVQAVKEIFGRSLAIDPDSIDEEEEINTYLKRNSMKIIEITVELRKIFKGVMPTLLFKYHTIAEVAQELEKHQKVDTEKVRTEDGEAYSGDDIAIIGLNVRLPGAKNAEEFWDNLKNGVCSIGEIPVERWNVGKYYNSKGECGKYYNKNGGFLEHIDEFAASFFHISPLEAETMDPQQRIILEIVYGLFEDAGYEPSDYAKKTGVFVGVISGDYATYANVAATRGNCTYRDVDYYQIANRISYCFDFSGPSIAVDTACSSSGTALYYAIQSIRNGDCDSAVVGGVNLFLHPGRFIQYSQMNVLSHDGVCRPFSEKASGTVYGEGAAAVLIKPLKEAIIDGDNIYGVIRGEAINSVGRTNGFTVPSPTAQADLIEKALTKANVSPEDISYVEAHGTGTVLGDPIEIDGLMDAYERCAKKQKITLKKQYCPIGSVKSNIGHTESAATLTGLAKVLLQLRHGKIVETLNVGKLNPYIPFEESPFYVQQTLSKWKRNVKCEQGKEAFPPRRAALSSFGAGGVNTHFIIEEYKKPERKADREEQLFVFSAQTKELLDSYVGRMKKYLEKCQMEQELPAFCDVAYTLQVGRGTFEQRLAVIAQDYGHLLESLGDYLKGRVNENVYQVFDCIEKKTKKKVDLQGLDCQEAAQLWIEGKKLNWKSWHTEKKYRVSLPQTGFEREHFWLDEDLKEETAVLSSHAAEGIDSLLDAMQEGLQETCFTKEISPKNKYFHDHIIDGGCILPGAVYFEFIYEVFQGMHISLTEHFVSNICWMKAIEVTENIVLHISIAEKKEDYICTFWTKQEHEKVIHATMQVSKMSEVNTRIMNTKTVRESTKKNVEKQECYDALALKKYQYGSMYRVVEQIQYNDDYACGNLKMEQEWNEISFAPNIIDGALQVVSVWARKNNQGFDGTFIPFTIDSVTMQKKINRVGIYTVLVKENRKDVSAQIRKYDLEIVDAQDELCMSIHGYYAREFGRKQETMLIVPKRKMKQLDGYTRQLEQEIVLFGRNTLLRNELEKCNHGRTFFADSCISEKDYEDILGKLVSEGVANVCAVFFKEEEKKTLRECLEDTLTAIQNVSKAAVKIHELKHVKILYVYRNANDVNTLVSKSVSAAFQVLQEEISKIACQCVEIPVESSIAAVAGWIGMELVAEAKENVQYVESGRYSIQYEVQQDILPDEEYVYGEGKVILIIGGLGGLGFQTAKHIAEKEAKTILVLTGRTALDQERRMKLDELSSMCQKVRYIQADIAVKAEVERLMSEVKAHYGKLNGIIHCAGVIRDSLVVNKTWEEQAAVIAPKAEGVVYLDDVTKKEPLDFFVLYSSTSSVIPHIGQYDYAFANRFLDEFCQHREQMREEHHRSGKTVSINWSLWKDGGMSVSKEGLKRIARQYDIEPLETEQGMKMLDRILASEYAQLGVVAGNKEKLERIFGLEEENQMVSQKIIAESTTDKINEAIRDEIAKVLKMNTDKVKKGASFSSLGFDSITFTTLANAVNDKFDISVSPAIFYEYDTVERLGQYIDEKFEQNIKAIFSIAQDKRVEAEKKTGAYFNHIEEEKELLDKADTAGWYSEDDVVIVGMSGIFPQADDPQKLWENILNGTCAVMEIPKERWNWKEWYGTKENQTEIKYGAFIRGADEFEPQFFGISPKEALYMDPQQRLFLETAWRCVEDAGYNPRTLAESDTGVYAGVSLNDYNELMKDANAELDPFLSSGVNNSIVANRVSYFLNLHGPSEVIDTACSSSLVCLKHAVEAIKSGNCSGAIVGGVNIIARPKFFVSFGKAGMLSRNGRCNTFDAKADGYVRGEGVAAVYIKKYKDARKDGDHIYAVIKGISENHGGRSHSLTAPNPKAQAEVIRKAYENAGVPMECVDYIECHGTGTAIGDPIEINGLKEAFRALGVKNDNHCMLGALKANIGHLECASGIAGLIKTAMILTKKQVPKVACFQKQNPYIELEDSPFQICVENIELENHVDEQGRKMPICAGISAFGFGGTNAHAVLQEYVPEKETNTVLPGSYAVVLSARTKNSLRKSVENLFLAVKEDAQELNLADVAYTLQVGRQAMKERIAFMVNDMEQLKTMLQEYVEHGKKLDGVYEGSVADEEMEWMTAQQNNIHECVKQWAEGKNIRWEGLYEHCKRKRCSLPAYAFEKEHFWFQEEKKGTAPGDTVYYKMLTGDEYYLRDHIVEGHKMLPGIEHMNVVFEAVESLYGVKVAGFENIYYVIPTIADHGCSMKCEVVENDGKYGFKLYSAQQGEEFILVSQGTALTEVKALEEKFDMHMLRENMQFMLTKEEFYGEYVRRNFQVIGTFQTLEQIYYNDSEVLARMTIAADGEKYFKEQKIYTAFYDGALQSSAVLTGLFHGNDDEYLPFCFERVEITECLPEECYVYLRRTQQAEEVCLYDVFILDGQGRKQIALYGYHARKYKGLKEKKALYFLTPQWVEKSVGHTEKRADTMLLITEKEEFGTFVAAQYLYSGKRKYIKTILLGSERRKHSNDVYEISIHEKKDAEQVVDAVGADGFIPECIVFDWMHLSKTAFADGMDYIKNVVFGIQKNVEAKWQNRKIKTIYLVPDEAEHVLETQNGINVLLFEALSGFGKSVTCEAGKHAHKLVHIPKTMADDRLVQVMEEEVGCFDGYEVSYQNERRYLQCLQAEEQAEKTNTMKWNLRQNGIYLVTGGMGRLGMMIISELLEQSQQITIIATGKTAYNDAIKTKIENLQKGNSSVVYYQTDIVDLDDTKKLIATIQKEHGGLHGVIHCAGILRDAFLINKTAEDIDAVFGPKIEGVRNLDLATQSCPLEVFVMFSSVSGFAGNNGQTDYAYANCFMDNYARVRNQLWHKGERNGKTVVIAWPFWKDGGMQLEERNLTYIEKNTGMVPLETKMGIETFCQCLNAGREWTGVIYGNSKKMLHWIERLNHPYEEKQDTGINRKGQLGKDKAQFEEKMMEILSKMLGTEKEKLHADTKLEEIGMNSFLYVELSNEINEMFHIDTLPSVFFEFATVEALLTHIWNQHVNAITLDMEENEEEDVFVDRERTEKTTEIPIMKSDVHYMDDPVVIVGMDVFLPGSFDAEEFWNCLLENVDMIGKISSDRIALMGNAEGLEEFLASACDTRGGYLSDVDGFDAEFFKLSRKESEYMDPQHRLILQSAWKTIEDAGYRVSDFAGTDTGVYIGIAGSDYYDVLKDSERAMDAYALTGNMAAFAANRISYLFHLHGPSEPINTACSSSLVALEHALKDIRLGRCRQAIVGGVNILTNRRYYEATVDSGVLSKDGCCKALDSRADGYVRSEGVGSFLLKRFSDAKRDRDHIYGIVREVGVNHCGHTSSLTAPSETSQKELIVKTYKDAGIPFNSVGLIEMHGTGTELGDPIEFNALKRAAEELSEFNVALKTEEKIGLTSAKTTLGHLEAAAGVAGIAKVLLSMKHKMITGNIHFKQLNPYIRLENTPFYVVRENTAWKRPEALDGTLIPRRAGISSFGFGGSSAHAILEEYMEEKRGTSNDGEQLVVLSAKTEEALYQYANKMYRYVKENLAEEVSLADIAFTLCAGREEMEKRFACVVSRKEEFMQCLLEFSMGTIQQSRYFTNVKENRIFPENQLEETAQKWTGKEKVYIKDLFLFGDYQRVSLPTYPFSRSKKYWIMKKKTTGFQVSILEKEWKRKEQETSHKKIDKVLLFTQDDEVVESLRIQYPETEFIPVKKGLRFQADDAKNYFADLWNSSALKKFLEETIGGMEKEIFVIQYKWNEAESEISEKAFYSMVYLLKGMLGLQNKIQYIYGCHEDNTMQTAYQKAFDGLLKTVRLENREFSGHVLSMEGAFSKEQIAKMLMDELENDEQDMVTYRDSERLVMDVKETVFSSAESQKLVIQKGGVYVIVGGLGGIGRILARKVIEAGGYAVLTGRKKKDKNDLFLQQLRNKAEYIQMDITNLEQVKQCVREIHASLGKITGVFNCSGVIEDQYLKYKEEDSMYRVLAPKIAGNINLDLVLAQEPLEYFVMFSSVAGIFGNYGQCDYAYGNAFVDSFAEYREHLRKQGERSGRTLAVAWSYWKNGGMRIQRDVIEEMNQEMGTAPIPDDIGMEALFGILKKSGSYYAVMYGTKECYKQMHQRLYVSMKIKNVPEEVANTNPNKKSGLDEQALENYIHELFSELFGVEKEELEDQVSFQNYGIDSITVQKFNRKIKDMWKGVPTTILYECENIGEVLQYLKQKGTPRVEEFQLEKTIMAEEIVKKTERVELDKIEKTECESARKNSMRQDDIAIIGMSGCYPGAENLDEFWENLCNGVDSVTEVPVDRWDWKKLIKQKTEDYRDDVYCHWGGFLAAPGRFDPAVFGISPREAVRLDPQERLLLQEVWKAFEQAGCAHDYLSRKNGKKQKSDVGVFIGTTTDTYSYQILEESKGQKEEFSGSGVWSMSNRISYTFGFSGPSLSVDTACSSSLVAIKLACDSLKNGECKIAVTGGVNLYAHPHKYAQMCATGMLTKTGKCYSFGTEADGFVPGEGVGVLILKPLKEAEKAKDMIFGVIKGYAVNHGVSGNGFTVPNPVAQAEVIEKAMKDAGVLPSEISYIEAHGTGTKLGDPIEIEGLEKVFGKQQEGKKCYIGSLKSNIGHLESASGVAGIIKILLQFQHKMLVPSIHCEKLNENINFKDSIFQVQRTLDAWESRYVEADGMKVEQPRMAGISSFGVGGSNAHFILQEYKSEDEKQAEGIAVNEKQMFVLSAADEESLQEYAKQIYAYLKEMEVKNKSDNKADDKAEKQLQQDILQLISRQFSVSMEYIEPTAKLSEYTNDFIMVSSFQEMLKVEYHLDIEMDMLKGMTAEQIAEQILLVSPYMIQKTSNETLKQWFKKFCFTLQKGRVALSERIGFVVSDLSACIKSLGQYCSGEWDDETIYCAHAARNVETVTNRGRGEDWQEYVVKKWVEGAFVAWDKLYDIIPERITDIPNYPFHKQEFWFRSKQVKVQEHQIEEKIEEIKEEQNVQVSLPSLKEREEVKHVMKKEEALGIIKKILADVLYMDVQKIDPSKAFIDLGLDSILGVEFVSKLNKEFHLNVKAMKIYDYPSVDEFSVYVASIEEKKEPETAYQISVTTAAEEVKVEQERNEQWETKEKPSLTLKETRPAVEEKQKKLTIRPSVRKEVAVEVEIQNKAVGKVEKKTVEEMPQQKAAGSDEIAVIGMSLRTAGADNIEEFWNLISKGKCAVEDIPKERWDTDKYYDPTGTDKEKSYTKKSAWLKDIDKFDSLFFHISPADAKNMEPQQRLFLEEAWKTFEHAGYSKQALNDIKCGVYVGVASINEYNSTNMFNTSSILASRIAYFLNLRGPALAIDTACSSSMTAIHMACNSLLNGEADMMLAGGVSIYLTEKLYVQMCKAGMLSKAGVCSPFSDDADGFVTGEGVGAVLLKRLDKAIADKDNILGVIKASGCNQDGRTNGITAPSARSQKELEIEVYKKAKINPEKITMVEAHGTGTNLGDPIEFDALSEAYQEFTTNKKYCALGSVKANVGHTAAASGVVSLIKLILCMNRKQIPPQIHFTGINKNIDIENSSFYINKKLKEWESDEDGKRYAAVSSFGFSGTNVHMILENYVEREKEGIQKPKKPYYLVCFSAESKGALHYRINDFVSWLDKNRHADLGDISYSLLNTRSHMHYRIALVVSTIIELRDKLIEILCEGTVSKLLEQKEDSPLSVLKPMMHELGRILTQELCADGLTDEEYYSKIQALANMYMISADFNYEMLFKQGSFRKLILPAYRFEEKSYWCQEEYKSEVGKRNVVLEEKTTEQISKLESSSSKRLNISRKPVTISQPETVVEKKPETKAVLKEEKEVVLKEAILADLEELLNFDEKEKKEENNSDGSKIRQVNYTKDMILQELLGE